MRYASLPLSRYLSWLRVLPLLGIRPKTLSLPAVTDCPLCGGQRLHIFADTTRTGQWYRCYDCQSYGDMVDLASNTWQLDIEATVRRLALISDCPLDVEEQVAKETAAKKYTADIRKLLDESAEYAKTSKRLETLANKLHINCAPTSGVWTAVHDYIFRGCDFRSLELCFAPVAALAGGREHNKGIRVNNPSDARFFRGPGWKDVFIIPFYCLQDQLTAICAIGREGVVGVDTPTRRLSHGLWEHESGVAVHPDFYTKDAKTLFCISDPVQYLRLYSTHLTSYATPLPLVLWRDLKTGWPESVWQHLRTQRYVFFVEKLTAAVVKQLILSNGFGFCPNSAGTSLANYTRRYSPAQLFKLMDNKAKHWTELLSDFVAGANSEQVDALFSGLEAKHVAASTIFQAMGSEFEQTVTAMRRRLPNRILRLNKEEVLEERDTGWYVAATDELVSEAMLFVDEAVFFPRFNKTYYRGHVQFRGARIDFCEESTAVVADPIASIFSCVHAAQLGLPKFSSRWRNRLFEVSSALSNTEPATGIDTVGWNQRRSEFVFPKIVIGSNGAKTHNELVYPEQMPAGHISCPVSGADMATGLLEETNSNLCFWAIWIALVRNIVAPVHNEATCGVVAAGVAADVAALHVSRALGLVDYPLSSGTLNNAFAAEYRHKYPIAAGVETRTSQAMCAWLNASDRKNRNGLSIATPLQAFSAGTTGRWLPVAVSGFDDSLDYDERWIELLPSFLAYIAKRNFRLPPEKTYLKAIYDSVSRWLLETTGQCTVVDSAQKLLFPAFDVTVSSFTKTINWLVRNTNEEIKLKLFKRNEAGLQVCKETFQSCLQKHKAVLPKIPILSHVLQKSGCLQSELNSSYWLLSPELATHAENIEDIA